MKLDWSNWIYGLFRGFIGGGAASIVSGPVAAIIAPQEVNFQSGVGKLFLVMGVTFLLNGLIHTAMYLSSSPLPAIIPATVTTTTVTAGRASNPDPVVVTTVQETHIEPTITPKG